MNKQFIKILLQSVAVEGYFLYLQEAWKKQNRESYRLNIFIASA